MITSKENKLIKHIKSLTQKKNRDKNNEYIIEGIKLVQEAINEKQDIKKIIICKELLNIKVNTKDYDIEEVDKKTFVAISDTITPQGILAIIKKPKPSKINGPIIFALERVQDPGNVGTIIRTLECTGIKDIIISSDSAEPYNPKVVRSTMGAIFRVNIYNENELTNQLKEMKEKGYKIIASTLEESTDYTKINYKEKCVIVIGNESNGISKETKEIADIKIKIPMLGKTESLNAGVAASIIAYETIKSKNI